MREKKVLGKSLILLYDENKKENIRGLNFNNRNKSRKFYIDENKGKKYQIINR